MGSRDNEFLNWYDKQSDTDKAKIQQSGVSAEKFNGSWFTDTINIATGGTYTLDHTTLGLPDDSKENRIVQVYQKKQPLGIKHSHKILKGYDPGNYTTLENRLCDGNHRNYIYNNKKRKSSGVWYGIEATSPIQVQGVKIYDYFRHSKYMAKSWSFDWFNNGTWENIHTITDHKYCPDGFEVVFPEIYSGQFWRINCLAGVNTSYWMLGELELFGPSDFSASWQLDNTVIAGIKGNQTIITNEGLGADFKVRLLFT